MIAVGRKITNSPKDPMDIIRSGFPSSYLIKNKKVNKKIEEYLCEYEQDLFYYLSDIWNKIIAKKNLNEKNKVEFFKMYYENHFFIVDSLTTSLLTIFDEIKNCKAKFEIWEKVFNEITRKSLRIIWAGHNIYIADLKHKDALAIHEKNSKRNELKRKDREKYRKYCLVAKLMKYLEKYQPELYDPNKPRNPKNWWPCAIEIANLKSINVTTVTNYVKNANKENPEFIQDSKVNSYQDFKLLHNHWEAYIGKYTPSFRMKQFPADE